jgi:hypothetical protein
MGWIRPFHKVEKHNHCVDENRQNEADQEYRKRIADGFGNPQPAQ